MADGVFLAGQTKEEEGTPPSLQSVVKDVNAFREGYQDIQRSRRATALVGLIILVLLAGGLYFTARPVSLVTLIALGGLYIWYQYPSHQYSKRFKKQVLPLIAQTLGNITWSDKGNWSEKELAKSSLLPPYQEMTSQDHFQGEYKGLPFHLSEVALTYKPNENESLTAFEGWFLEVTLPQSLPGKTIATKDYGFVANKLIGLRHWGLQRISLEDPRFEKLFEVYGSDQTVARRFLTPSLMERLSDLPSHFQAKAIAVSLRDNILFATIPYKRFRKKRHFQPPPLHKPVTEQDVRACSDELVAVLAVIDYLKLAKA